METQNETKIHSATPDTTPRTIKYAELVPVIQLSVARSLNVPGSIEAHSFAEVCLSRSAQERRSLEIEVGGHFDEALINFVISAVLANRHRPLIIEAEADAGINGYLPWHDRLNERLEVCKEKGILASVSVTVEQKQSAETPASVEALYERALELAS